MANDTDNPGRSARAMNTSFNWDTFDAMLDGLQSDELDDATAIADDRSRETQPVVDAESGEQPIGPTLPRIDPSELAHHRLRARRRRALSRRAQRSTEVTVAPDVGGDEEYDEDSEQQMAERLANRFAPASSSDATTASVYAPRHRKRIRPEADYDEEAGFDQADDVIVEMQPDETPGRQSWRHLADLQPPEHGRAVLFGSLAMAALFLLSVSAFALLGDRGERASGAGERIAKTEAAPSAVVGLHDPEPQNDPRSREIAPLMSAPKSAELAGAQRLVPRRPQGTPFKKHEAEVDLNRIATKVAPEATLTVTEGPDTANPVSVRGKSDDRLLASDSESKPSRLVRDGPVTLGYAPANPASTRAPPAEEPKAPAGTAGEPPPEADAAPVELASRTPAESDSGGESERAEKLRLDLLLTRGREILKSGDLMSARLLFARVAEAGDARGAIAMADTYDPEIFRKMNVIGLAPDAELSAHWRKRAAELGSLDR